VGALLVGCGSKTPLRVPRATISFVITDIVIDDTPADEVTPIAGFNVDGLFSTVEPPNTRASCEKPDSPAFADPLENCPRRAWDARAGTCSVSTGCLRTRDCAGGVDNALPGVLDAVAAAASVQFPQGVRPVIRQRFSRRPRSLLVRVTGVDAFDDDREVTVFVYEGHPVDGCADGGVPGRYGVLSSSVIGGALDRPVIAPLRASIRSGRVVPDQRSVTTIAAASIFDGLVFDPEARIEDARLSFPIDETDGSSGNLGGSIDGSAVLRAIREFVSNAQALAIVAGFVDIPIRGSEEACSDRNATPPALGRIGVGVYFSLRRIEIEPTTIDRSPTDACAP